MGCLELCYAGNDGQLTSGVDLAMRLLCQYNQFFLHVMQVTYLTIDNANGIATSRYKCVKTLPGGRELSLVFCPVFT